MAIEISFPMFASLNQFLWHFPAEIHDHFQSLRCFVFIVFIRRTIQDNSTRQQLKDLLSASSRIADCYNAPKAPYINGTAPFASQNNFRCPEKFRLNQTEPWIGNKVRSILKSHFQSSGTGGICNGGLIHSTTSYVVPVASTMFVATFGFML